MLSNVNANLQPFDNHHDDDLYLEYSLKAKNQLSQLKKKAVSLLSDNSQPSVDAYVTPIQDKGYKAVFNFVEIDYPSGTEIPSVKVIQVEIKEFYLS